MFLVMIYIIPTLLFPAIN